MPNGRWSDATIEARHTTTKTPHSDLKTTALHILALSLGIASAMSCSKQKEHTAPAIHDRDSVSMMTSYGVNTLISDSGVIKYRIVAERWEVNQTRNPSRWIFEKGLFCEQFDEKFHVQAYIQCDTAYYYDRDKLWELRGRVKVRNKDGLDYSSEQLYWDEGKQEFYSHVHSRLVTPERTLEGNYFRSDQRMNKYYVSRSSGSFEKGDLSGQPADTTKAVADTTKTNQRPQAQPRRKAN